MFLADRLVLDAPRRTADGFLAVRAKAARVGVYSYTGREVDPDNAHGLRDQATVNVLRDDATVFDKRAVHSFIGKPITNDHPSEAVTAANWKDHARGTVMGAEWQEGGYLAFDLLLTDADAIAKVDAGKRELSNGYSATLEYGDFTAADGTKCAARQTGIVGNHVAIVDRGRAGPSCRIADAAPCSAAPTTIFEDLQRETSVKTMLIDGLTVDISNADTAQATITTLVAARDAANVKVAGLETEKATLATDKATLEATNATLVKQVADARNPAALRDAARSYAVVTGKAKALGVIATDSMDETAIMKVVVDKALGDTAKGWNDAQITASFAALTKDAKVEDVDPLRDAIRDHAGPVNDAAAEARAQMIADMQKGA